MLLFFFFRKFCTPHYEDKINKTKGRENYEKEKYERIND